jgi:hypothetical protein
MDLKLTLLFFLIGAVISFSHLGRKNLIKLQSEFDGPNIGATLRAVTLFATCSSGASLCTTRCPPFGLCNRQMVIALYRQLVPVLGRRSATPAAIAT